MNNVPLVSSSKFKIIKNHQMTGCERMEKYNYSIDEHNIQIPLRNSMPLQFNPFFLLLPTCYSMEYARITSTMGARHKGHLPSPRTNSFAHFEHAHMCPHLKTELVYINIQNINCIS